jgi:hypothetical protein
MQCVLVALLIFTTLLMLAGFGWAGSRVAVRGSKAYDRLAAHYRGIVYRPGWFGNPRVSFEYRSAAVLVGMLPESGSAGHRGPLTWIQIVWPDANFSCAISHPPGLVPLAAHDGLVAWRSGLGEFDGRYSVRTSDQTLMSGMMNQVVRGLIEQLRRWPRPGALLVEVQRGVLRVSKGTSLHRPADLLEFVRLALELYDQALLLATEGIEFVDQPFAQPLAHVVCQVCGEEIASDLVFCQRCKTPHHRDCWLYVGRCSVFGCGEIQFQVPRQASRNPNRPGDRL